MARCSPSWKKGSGSCMRTSVCECRRRAGGCLHGPSSGISGGSERDLEFARPVACVAVELGGPSGGQPAPEFRTAGNPSGEQVGAGDLQLDQAQMVKPL